MREATRRLVALQQMRRLAVVLRSRRQALHEPRGTGGRHDAREGHYDGAAARL